MYPISTGVSPSTGFVTLSLFTLGSLPPMIQRISRISSRPDMMSMIAVIDQLPSRAFSQ